jgi:hypothetical protein
VHILQKTNQIVEREQETHQGMGPQNSKNKKGVHRKSFETSYDPVQRCMILRILDTEGFTPFFLLQHPKTQEFYRIHIKDTGIHTTK